MTSDLLDDALPTALKKAHATHLASCPRCTQKHQNYHSLLTTLSQFPQAPLPAELKTYSKLPSVPRIESILIRLGQWDRLPWYIRTLLEGVGIVCLVLIGVSIAPKIRSFYESYTQARLNDYEDPTTHPAPAAGDVPPVQVASASNAGSPSADSEDAISGEAEGETSDEEAPQTTHARASHEQSQLWRFTLKTVSPDELRPLVIQALTILRVPGSTPGMQGVQVPGGIEFDLLLPADVVPDLKAALEKLVARPPLSPPQTTPDPPDASRPPGSGEDFSWYRVHSKKKISTGMAKVVIWLSQPH